MQSADLRPHRVRRLEDALHHHEVLHALRAETAEGCRTDVDLHVSRENGGYEGVLEEEERALGAAGDADLLDVLQTPLATLR